MKITALKTEKILPAGDNIFAVLDKYLKDIEENSILAITSKIVSICEGNVVEIGAAEKDDLIKQEADFYLPRGAVSHNFLLTIKNGVLLPSAGIDESNGNGYYILWPKNPQESANLIREYLKKRFKLQNVGVIITDSKTTPLRWGTVGVAIAYSGFSPLNNYIGTPDIFGHELGVTRANVMDGLAVSAVLVMGEGSEQTPLAIIEDIPFVTFQKNNPSEQELKDLNIDIKDDLYSELLQSVNWQKK